MFTCKRFLCWCFAALMGLAFPFPSNATAMETTEAHLTTPPEVPLPTGRTQPAHVVVRVQAKELIGSIGDGVQYKLWTFNGTVPGPMVRVRVGDTVEVRLENPKENKFAHNMDLHAVNGPGGGAGANLAFPGATGVFTFKALAPGLFMYHCASPVPNPHIHLANGMYGMILVEPEHGLPKVDREYAVVQSEFFTKPSEDKDVLEFSMEKGLAEHSDYVVFNGHTGSLLGKGELKASVGETVRLYFGNIGPNSASSFHIIGEIFDNVHTEGTIGGTVNHHVQSTLVPAAGATILEFKVDVPGAYVLVDHSFFRVAKGALGILKVGGKDDPSIFQAHPTP